MNKDIESEIKQVEKLHGENVSISLSVLIRLMDSGKEREHEVTTVKNWLSSESAKGRRYPAIHEYIQQYEVHQ